MRSVLKAKQNIFMPITVA